MWRRLRWILLALIVVVVGGAVALAVVERPKLEDDRDAVDARWSTLRPPLDDRYDLLADALTAFAAAGGGDRAVTKELGAALSAWTTASRAKEPAEEVEAANHVEAQATRLRTNVLGSPRLSKEQALIAAVTAFDGSAPAAALVEAYNRNVVRYQEERRSTLGAPVARILGYDERPVLVLGG